MQRNKTMSWLEILIIDLALITRASGSDEGTPVHREPVVWVAADPALASRRPLPLGLFSPGCRFRDVILEHLETAGIPYRTGKFPFAALHDDRSFSRCADFDP